MPMQRFFNPMMFGTEFIYTIIILVFCFVIYLKTKDMYDLTKYKGIKYFRNAFLFFGLAYLTRFVLHLLMISTIGSNFFIPMRLIQLPVLVLTGYFSTMALFSLVYSLIWKKIKEKYFLAVSSIIAILVSLATLLTRSHSILISLQLVLLIAVAILGFVMHKKTKKSSQIGALYIFVLVFWLFNLFVTGPRRIIPFEIKIVSQIISLIVFIIIYRKVSKWTK